MRTELDHLPPTKQRELERVVEIVFEEFGDALALAKHEWKVEELGRTVQTVCSERIELLAKDVGAAG